MDEENIMNLDEINQWLYDKFSLLPGCCSSINELQHSTARMVAEALWPKKAPRQAGLEEYSKIKRTLALGFMNVLDEHRTEGKMCLSNMECADIDKAFDEQDWPKLARYLDKYFRP